jgi:hypothetical protein
MARKKRDRKETAKKPTKGRGARGRFAPGNPGGPGRPRGSRNATTMLVEAMLADDAETLTRALIRQAKMGRGVALQLVFERIAPVRRERPVEMHLPALRSTSDLVAAHDTLLAQVASGDIAPAEANTIAHLLELRRKAFESSELETRLAALEARYAAVSPTTH